MFYEVITGTDIMSVSYTHLLGFVSCFYGSFHIEKADNENHGQNRTGGQRV